MLSQFIPILGAFVLFLVFWRVMQGGQQHARSIRDGDRLMLLGRTAEALAAYEAAVRHAPKNALGPSKVGIAKTILWRTGAALEAFAQARAASVGGITPSAIEHEALVKALRGDASGARRSLQEVPVPARDSRLTALVEAVLMARAANFPGVLDRVSGFDAKQLAGVLGALGRTLEAWAAEMTSGERRHVDRVALYGESGPDELGRAWPELVAFTERAPH